MEREELERQVADIIHRAISVVNEILTPLEDDPEEYLEVVNRISDNMIRTATNAISPKIEKPEADEASILETVEIGIEQFEKEYSANPIKARRNYTGKIVNVNTTMDDFEKYLANGATPSINQSSERKYMYKNVYMIIPATISFINELYKKEDGTNYEVRFKGTNASGKEWELVSFFPKEAGKQIETVTTGQLVKIKGHYEGRKEKENRYFFRDCEFVGLNSTTGNKRSKWLYAFIFVLLAAAAYYFFKK